MQLHTDNDIIIRAAPRRRERHPDRSAPEDPRREYDVFVYAKVPLPMAMGGRTPGKGEAELRGLPLRGVGKLTIKWPRYQDLLAQFFDGDKGVEAMYFRMRDTLSDPLQELVDFVRGLAAPVRVWWANDAPELDDMPWDLLFYGQYGDPAPVRTDRVSCVRGLPPAVPPPLLAVSGPLRVLWDARRAPQGLQQLFQAPLPNVVAVPFDGPVREALLKARAEGFEVVHFNVDGVVSLAYEGVLCHHGDPVPQISAAEVSQLIAGSRVSLLCLSPENASVPDTMRIAGREVASAYRAFTCFASARVTLPSMIVPIAPAPDAAAMHAFWTTFYGHLAASHDAEKSLAQARAAAPASPHTLFLRHAQGKLFRAGDRLRGRVKNPERLTMLVRGFAEANTVAQAIKARYGELPGYLRDLLSDRRERQADIEADLEEWARPDGERE